jgi:ankyrin repeat protein
MSNLIKLIRNKASIEEIKADLYDNLGNEDYVNVVDGDSRTAFMYACILGNIGAVKLLLEANVDVNVVKVCGGNALMYACINGETEVVKLLLEANADVNIVDGWGMTALKIAEQNGHTEIVELLNNHNNYIMFNGKKYKLVKEE